ncbi:MAG: carboxypeptidase regulatory-like domain-containing protein [Acidobacteriota bacterium]
MTELYKALPNVAALGLEMRSSGDAREVAHMMKKSTLVGLAAWFGWLGWIASLTLLFYAATMAGAQAAPAQPRTGSIQGTITDPDGALVPQADVTIWSSHGNGRLSSARRVKSDASGAFDVTGLAPGSYTVTVTARGFSTIRISDVVVARGRTTDQNVKLAISVESQVTVTAHAEGLSTNPEENSNVLVIKGKDLDALSDDPDDLQNELTALAGPAAGPNGAQIFIDGFTAGQLPPKSSILEIRINRNPFSAEYDKLGYGRIEILTKPGTQSLHGFFMIDGNDKPFNALNPFVTSEPPYYSTFMNANLSGPVGASASWFGSVFQRNNQSNSIINAEILGANGQQENYTTAVSNPQTRLDVSPRFDFELGSKNVLSVRYMLDRQIQTNSGVSGFALQSQGYDVTDYENTVQVSDTQVYGPRWVNQIRFQYMGDRDSQAAQQTSPTETVEGDFTGGGNNQGTSRDNQDHYELQEYVNTTQGAHTLNFGTRLRLDHEVNSRTSGFNGNYIYTSLSAYAAGTPSQYVVTAGKPSATVNLFDAALFYQDDWTLKPNLTFSYGVRYEGQNRISDHVDFAPRFSVSWAPWQTGDRKANTVLRAGYGWFYDRFASTYVLDAIHGNGVNQQNYVVNNPDFNSNAPPPSELPTSTSAPIIYQVDPRFKASQNMQAAVGIDHSFGNVATLSLTYLNSRGVHQYLSDNINAFLPSTFNPATGAGVRPNGINENIYQFQSGGIYRQNELIMNYSVHARNLTLFGFYMFNSAHADTSGPTYFPTVQTNPGGDYGRATFDIKNRLLIGGNIQAPFGISLSPFFDVNSGSPFNITLGTDQNGNNQFNSRPSYADSSSTDTMQTPYGDLNLDPAYNQQQIPFDAGTGPSNYTLNLRVSKTIGIGPRVANGPSGPGGPPGGPHGGPHGGGPGGGLGPGGLSGGNGPPRLDQAVPRKYSLTFSVMSHNVLNHVNLAAPVGMLDSPLFNRSTSLAGGIFSSPASNRSIDLQANFSF